MVANPTKHTVIRRYDRLSGVTAGRGIKLYFKLLDKIFD